MLFAGELGPGIGALVRPDHLAGLSPIDDVRGTAAYRRSAAEVLVRRALEELGSRTAADPAEVAAR